MSNDHTFFIEDNPARSGLDNTGINGLEELVPIMKKLYINEAPKSLKIIRFELDTKMMSLEEAVKWIQYGFIMLFPWVGRTMGTVMDSIHNLSPGILD